MLGLPASAGAPALAETGGRAVAQLLPPCCRDNSSLRLNTLGLLYFCQCSFLLFINSYIRRLCGHRATGNSHFALATDCALVWTPHCGDNFVCRFNFSLGKRLSLHLQLFSLSEHQGCKHLLSMPNLVRHLNFRM